MKIFLPSLIVVFVLIFQGSGVRGGQLLCDAEGIQLEIAKAIKALKRMEEISRHISPVQPRQEDDDDDGLPYYVPAIAKVVASVLAQNATNVIEESFGFIPPEINQNIRYVIGLVADTVAKLRPTEAPRLPTKRPIPLTPPPVRKTSTPSLGTDSSLKVPTSSSNSSTPGSEPISDLEALLAFAIHQQLASAIASSESSVPVVATESSKVTQSTESPIVNETQDTVPKLFSSTFKYSEGKSVTSNPELPTSDELQGYGPVYAPAYAPNYAEPTTRFSVYAPSFDHNLYSTPVPSTSKSQTSSPLLSVTVETTTTINSQETTTDIFDTDNVSTVDDDDEKINNEDLTTTRNSLGSRNVTSNTLATESTTEDEDVEDYEEVRRALTSL